MSPPQVVVGIFLLVLFMSIVALSRFLADKITGFILRRSLSFMYWTDKRLCKQIMVTIWIVLFMWIFCAIAVLAPALLTILFGPIASLPTWLVIIGLTAVLVGSTWAIYHDVHRPIVLIRREYRKRIK